MRIAYGVFGYGRGHATRALGVLRELTKRHDVRIFAGGDAYDTLSPSYAVHRVPRIAYEYGVGARRSILQTVLRNFPTTTDAILGGGARQCVVDEMRRLRPDFAIVDCDPFVHHAAVGDLRELGAASSPLHPPFDRMDPTERVRRSAGRVLSAGGALPVLVDPVPLAPAEVTGIPHEHALALHFAPEVPAHPRDH